MSTPRKISLELQNMLHALANSELPDTTADRDTKQHKVADLRASFRRMNSSDPARFKPGDLVRWQPHMKYTTLPAYGEPAVVVEVLSHEVLSSGAHPCSTYYRSPCTLVLGVPHKGGFHCWHFDGRRFELAT